MTTQVNTSRISNKINNLKNQLTLLESTYELGMAQFSKDLTTCISLFDKYGIENFEVDVFVDDYFNFKIIQKTFKMSAVKGNNLAKALKALNVGFHISVFNPTIYKGTSLYNSPASITISYFFKINESEGEKIN